MKFKYSEVKTTFHYREPWINIFLLKYLTLPLTYFIVNYTKLTPNIITIFSLLFGITSAYFYFNNQVLLGALCYIFSYLMDAIDGKVARLKKIKSDYGAWLDIFVDRFNFIIITIALSCAFLIDVDVLFAIIAPSLLIGLFLIGFESRYNIQSHELMRLIDDRNWDTIKNWKISSSDFERYEDNIDTKENRFKSWTLKKGVINYPVSLPEIIIFLFVVSPILDVVELSFVIAIFIFLIRVFIQQKYWFSLKKL